VDYLDKKAIGDSFLCLLSLLFKESRGADKAKHPATIINKASMSADEAITLKHYSINNYSKKLSLRHSQIWLQLPVVKLPPINLLILSKTKQNVWIS